MISVIRVIRVPRMLEFRQGSHQPNAAFSHSFAKRPICFPTTRQDLGLARRQQ